MHAVERCSAGILIARFDSSTERKTRQKNQISYSTPAFCFTRDVANVMERLY